MLGEKLRVSDYLAGVDAAPTYIQEAIDNMFGYWVGRVADRSRTHHAFTSRTGTLVQAIQEDTSWLAGKVWVDEMLAPYAKYVYNGHRSWAPDMFIAEALDDLAPDIQASLAHVLEEGWATFLNLKT